MKTIPFRFEFHQATEKVWRVEVYLEGESEPFYGHATFKPPPGCTKPKAQMPIAGGHKPKTEAERERERVNEAWLKAYAAMYPQQFAEHNRPKAKTFEEFKQQSIATMQLRARDSASLSGIIYAPTNYVSEFWTKDHVCRLAKALARPRKTIPLLALKEWLVDNWIPLKLFDLTAEQLAEKANSAMGTDYRAAKIWQTAYRGLGLYTHRTHGPPSR